MKAAYKLVIDANSCTGILFIENGKTSAKNNRQSVAAEREMTNGYIMTEELRGGFCRFDVTTILGDMMNSKNAVFGFIKATVRKPERFAYVQSCLEEYFSAGDYTVQRISQLMGKHGASFGETGETGLTVYNCSNLQQVAFSILHFLILSGFKFASCKHCGRLYATKTLKKEYCNRKSTFEGYEEYSCGEARKKIVDTLNKRRNALGKSLKRRWGLYDCPVDEAIKREIGRGVWNKWESLYWDLETESERLLAKIKERASVENLKEFQKFLYSEKFPKPYEREVETKR